MRRSLGFLSVLIAEAHAMALNSVKPFRRGAVLLAAILFSLISAGAKPPPDYSGNYELAGKKLDRQFALTVRQTGKKAEVTFSAAMINGGGAAPEGHGTGRIGDGVLSFQFEDSFHNQGSCTLQPGHGGYQLVMTVTKVVEASPFHFYGQLLLRKVSDHAAAP